MLGGRCRHLAVLATMVLLALASPRGAGAASKASLAAIFDAASGPGPAADNEDLVRFVQAEELPAGILRRDDPYGYPKANEPAGPGWTCPIGHSRCSATTCNPANTVCCSDGRYCRRGPGGLEMAVCGEPGDVNCSRGGAPSLGPHVGCPPGSFLCSTRTCNPAGTVCCNDGQYCPDMTYCGAPGDVNCYSGTNLNGRKVIMNTNGAVGAKASAAGIASALVAAWWAALV